jgi:hypothetical protein
MSSSPSAVYDNKRFIERGSHKGKGLAVFTSGGDSQGMVILYLAIRVCSCDAKKYRANWTSGTYYL